MGHDFGGACVSYAMELFPSKIAKAVFVAAAMLVSGQSTLDMFSQKVKSFGLICYFVRLSLNSERHNKLHKLL